MKLRCRVILIATLVFLLVQSTVVWSDVLPVVKPEAVGTIGGGIAGGRRTGKDSGGSGTRGSPG
jgi:hypothetical protein